MQLIAMQAAQVLADACQEALENAEQALSGEWDCASHPEGFEAQAQRMRNALAQWNAAVKTVQPQATELPLTSERIRALADEDGYITVTVYVDLNDLACRDIEAINEWMDEAILGKDSIGCLADLSYPNDWGLQGIAPDGRLILQVTADVSDYLEWHDEDEGSDND